MHVYMHYILDEIFEMRFDSSTIYFPSSNPTGQLNDGEHMTSSLLQLCNIDLENVSDAKLASFFPKTEITSKPSRNH